MPPVKLILLRVHLGLSASPVRRIRYLLLDIHVGIGKESARTSANVVLVAAVVVTLLIRHGYGEPRQKQTAHRSAAHYSWQDWLIQRVTAVILVLFSIVLIGFVVHGSVGYGQWKALFGSNVFRILAMLFLLSVYYHAWIGVRDVLMDYVKPVGIRLAIRVGVVLFLAACSIWSFSILWGN